MTEISQNYTTNLLQRAQSLLKICYSSSQEISRILRKTKAYYRVLKRMPLGPIVSHMSQSTTSQLPTLFP